MVEKSSLKATTPIALVHVAAARGYFAEGGLDVAIPPGDAGIPSATPPLEVA